jgi:hypothetical protein
MGQFLARSPDADIFYYGGRESALADILLLSDFSRPAWFQPAAVSASPIDPPAKLIASIANVHNLALTAQSGEFEWVPPPICESGPHFMGGTIYAAQTLDSVNDNSE